MIYDGIVAYLLGIEMPEIHKALTKQFGPKKAKAAEMNWGACQAGYEFAAQNLRKSDPCRVERMNRTAGKIIIDGNAACALGSMFAGVTVVTWYPITPSSSLVESLIGYLKRFRIDKDHRQGHLRRGAGGRRTVGGRHGAGRRLGRGAIHDGHRRARAFR